MSQKFNIENNKRNWLYAILSLVSLLTIWMLSDIMWTVVFAITVAYVVYPLRNKLRNEGLSERQSSAITTLISVLFLITLALPFLLVLYRRREILIDFLRELPQTFTFEILEQEITIQASFIIESLRESVTQTAINIAQSTPSLLLKTVLLIALIYAILRKPQQVGDTIQGIVPKGHREMLLDYHKTIEKTLTGLYVVQVSTAVLTFIIALPIFYFLGYEPFISLALLAGIMQFIPVLGPSIIIIFLAVFEIITGDIFQGAKVLSIGLILVALLPDIILRPKLADRTTGMPASLYLLGFIGGILTLGAIGIIIGPLIVALLIETASQINQITEEK